MVASGLLSFQKELGNQAECPYMCAYKLVTVKFKWWGLQNKIENFIQKVSRVCGRRYRQFPGSICAEAAARLGPREDEAVSGASAAPLAVCGCAGTSSQAFQLQGFFPLSCSKRGGFLRISTGSCSAGLINGLT